MQVVIPHIKRNNDLLIRNIPYIKKNISADEIFIFTAKTNVPDLALISSYGVRVLDEDQVLPGLNISTITKICKFTGIPEFRAGWYFQQFLKMAWAISRRCTDWYIVWDSDTFPLHEIPFFDNQGRPLFGKKEEWNRAYFETIECLLGIERQVDYSFIAENMIINKKIMMQLLSDINSNGTLEGKYFYEKILNAAARSSNSSCGFSEFETYGNYATVKAPSLYQPIQRLACRKGARRFGLKPSREDLTRLEKKYDIVSFEQWDRIIPPLVFFNKALSYFLYFFTRESKL
jgi:hypothetical protein